MNEIRITLNSRVTNDLNISYTFVHMNTEPQNGEELGKMDGHFMAAYTRGYRDGVDEGNKT